MLPRRRRPRSLALPAVRVGLPPGKPHSCRRGYRICGKTRRKATGPYTSENLVGCVRCNRLIYVSEPARDLPVSPAVEQAVELARRGVITHLTIHGERVAAIVPESVLDAVRAAEDAEDAAEAEAAMREPGDSIPLEELEAEFGL